eukprot:TRINITY_DN7472_c0_g1_i2.p1 TRINITY_DN7472_c0_g1~~TRINITY_DN7472_c0_g1_i2.p1  ORF type:complete len:261 (-),score=40.05 TRINITY_DN7472_c0_g1_i2:723-1445(-)
MCIRDSTKGEWRDSHEDLKRTSFAHDGGRKLFCLENYKITEFEGNQIPWLSAPREGNISSNGGTEFAIVKGSGYGLREEYSDDEDQELRKFAANNRNDNLRTQTRVKGRTTRGDRFVVDPSSSMMERSTIRRERRYALPISMQVMEFVAGGSAQAETASRKSMMIMNTTNRMGPLLYNDRKKRANGYRPYGVFAGEEDGREESRDVTAEELLNGTLRTQTLSSKVYGGLMDQLRPVQRLC